MKSELGIYNNITISIIDLDKINLTDMWKAEGGEFHKKPSKWLNKKQAIEFIRELKGSKKTLLKTRTGRYGGTFAHWQIALAYAKYLSPEFHIWCNEVVKLHIGYEQNPEQGMSDYRQKCIDKWVAEGRDPIWIEKRLKGIDPRKKLMSTLGKRGQVSRRAYGDVSDMVNDAVLGVSAKEFKALKGVKTTRDAMTDTQLSATDFSEALLNDTMNKLLTEESFLTEDEKLKLVRETLKPLKEMMKDHHVETEFA